MKKGIDFTEKLPFEERLEGGAFSTQLVIGGKNLIISTKEFTLGELNKFHFQFKINTSTALRNL